MSYNEAKRNVMKELREVIDDYYVPSIDAIKVTYDHYMNMMFWREFSIPIEKSDGYNRMVGQKTEYDDDSKQSKQSKQGLVKSISIILDP